MRVSGITLPEKKRIDIALTSVYGIGRVRAREILDEVGVPYDKRAGEITTKEEGKIREAAEKYTIEGELKREIASDIKRLRDVACYRGVRHTRRLPVHGQRTKTNSRTRRGNVRNTMGTGRRAAEKK